MHPLHDDSIISAPSTQAGESYSQVCPNCGNPRKSGDRFCSACGLKFKVDFQYVAAERRQLTVLFADLVGSSNLSSRLDPEDLRDMIVSYQEACAKVVERHEGRIAQFLGDGCLVYFGYPSAHEDDPRRAVKAGLEIVSSVRQLDAHWKRRLEAEIRVRVGVHTGLVVVGEVGGGSRQEQLALGETPNIAARIQGLAPPDSVLVSDTTFRLVRGFFTSESAGLHTLRGLESAMELHRPLAETGAESRLEAADAACLTPFAGRDDECVGLLAQWDLALQGQRQAVLIRGEAGIGKSRQVRELLVRLAEPAVDVLACSCSPQYQNSGFYPISLLIKRRLALSTNLNEEEKFEALRLWLQELKLSNPNEASALLAVLIGLAVPQECSLNITPQRQRNRTIQTLCEILDQLSQDRPVLLIVEDLHWADASTLTFLDVFVQRTASAQIMALFTSRPDLDTFWSEASAVRLLEMRRMDHATARTMIASLSADQDLPDAMVTHILERAEGIPLYVEEVTKAFLESGLLVENNYRYDPRGAVADRLIPNTILDLLLARIDRLGPGKIVAQFASAIGREFTYDLLKCITQASDSALLSALERLVDAEVVYQQINPPEGNYIFKHALIQDAAYQSLLRAKRQEIHGKIAAVLMNQYPETVVQHPELVAHHLTASGQTAEAIPHWQKAGATAAQRSANVEAASHLSTALDLTRSQANDASNVQLELELLIALGPILMATRGYAHPQVAETYQRARHICQQAGDTPEIVSVLFGMWTYYVVRGDLEIARELCEQILRLAEEAQDLGALLEAQLVFGVTLYFLGDFPAACRHLELATQLYCPAQHRAHALVFGQEPGMASNIYLAKTLALMGDAEGAEHHRQLAASIAAETKHHHTSAYCKVYECFVKHLAEEIESMIQLAEEVIVLADEQGFPIWKAGAKVLMGFALARRGQASEGIALMQEGIDAWTQTGTKLYTPYWLGLLSQAERLAGDRISADMHLSQAVQLAIEGDEGATLVELQRLHAIAALESGDQITESRARLEEALAKAQSQGAGLWKARLAATLSGLTPDNLPL